MIVAQIVAFEMLKNKDYKPSPELLEAIKKHSEASTKLMEHIERDPYALQKLCKMLFGKTDHPYEQFLERQKRQQPI